MINLLDIFKKKDGQQVYKIPSGNDSPYWGNPEEMIEHPAPMDDDRLEYYY